MLRARERRTCDYFALWTLRVNAFTLARESI